LEPVVQGLGDLLARTLFGQRQIRGHPAQLRRSMFQFGRALLQRRGGALAIGDVGHEREGASAAGRRDVVHADFDWKRRAVAAYADEVQAAAPFIPVSKRRWHQTLDPLADQVDGRPAEHRFERVIRGDDHALGVHRHDALRGGLEQRPQRAIVFLLAARPPRLLRRCSLKSRSSPVSRVTLPSASRSARPRLWIHATVPSGRTIRNVLSHESFVFDVHISSRRASNCERSSSCTRVTHASGVAGSSGAKPYRERNRSSQST
jgi:hypothetical protein